MLNGQERQGILLRLCRYRGPRATPFKDVSYAYAILVIFLSPLLLCTPRYVRFGERVLTLYNRRRVYVVGRRTIIAVRRSDRFPVINIIKVLRERALCRVMMSVSSFFLKRVDVPGGTGHDLKRPFCEPTTPTCRALRSESFRAVPIDGFSIRTDEMKVHVFVVRSFSSYR